LWRPPDRPYPDDARFSSLCPSPSLIAQRPLWHNSAGLDRQWRPHAGDDVARRPAAATDLSAPRRRAAASLYGWRYPNTESLSRDRIESEGYRVKEDHRTERRLLESDVTRDPVPTRP
jgi:hypothetical protein